MDIHEYQAKLLLKEYGIPSPPFEIIDSLDQILPALAKLRLQSGMVKVQVHAGGRGKAGGVKFWKNQEELIQYAEAMLGMKILNKQTGEKGLIAHQLMLTEAVDIEKEYYLSAAIDRKAAQAILIASPAGGMDIETIAEKSPEKILRSVIPLTGKMTNDSLIEVAKFMGWQGKVMEQGVKLMAALARAFIELDASLLEINPLVLTKDGSLIALDAKLSIDDNALFRQPKISQLFDPTQLLENEVLAREYGLAYIALDGEIGCMVNGAGLAMATMDIIHHYGGKPANFLDVGGGASEEKIAQGFKIILLDPQVKTILVNIFGGIMNCATLASGILSAARSFIISVPIVMRMEGTNVEQGKKMLIESGLNIRIADTLSEAAQMAVKITNDSSWQS